MIRPAKKNEAESLTKISFESKGYWQYPKQFFEVWKKELTINPNYILDNEVFVLERNGSPIGYYSIVELKKDIKISGIKINKGYWLDHMFILPQFIGKGLGRKMFNHLSKRCEARQIQELCVLADPNSKMFYKKMGCKYQKEYPSTIKNRTTPLLTLRLKAC